jgi:hypothetical protein
MVELPDALKVKRWPRRTRSNVECLRAGTMLFFATIYFGPEGAFDCYAKARNGRRDFWDAMRGIMMVEEALARNLRQAKATTYRRARTGARRAA